MEETTKSPQVQLDLFGEVEAAEDRAAQRAREAAEWQARFERADWVAPWDCSSGMKKGESTLGWRCPACGDIEPNSYLLGINHGLDPEIPRSGMEIRFTECTSMWLQASQARSAEQRRQAARES